MVNNIKDEMYYYVENNLKTSNYYPEKDGWIVKRIASSKNGYMPNFIVYKKINKKLVPKKFVQIFNKGLILKTDVEDLNTYADENSYALKTINKLIVVASKATLDTYIKNNIDVIYRKMQLKKFYTTKNGVVKKKR